MSYRRVFDAFVEKKNNRRSTTAIRKDLLVRSLSRTQQIFLIVRSWIRFISPIKSLIPWALSAGFETKQTKKK